MTLKRGKEWGVGFEEGIIWAVAEIVRQHKDTIIAKDVFKASGIDILKHKQLDKADLKELRKIGGEKE